MPHLDPGSRPRADSREDLARLDFIEGARAFVSGQMAPAALRQGRALLTDAFASPKIAAKDLATVGAVVGQAPITPVRQRLARSVQEMIWHTTHETLHKQSKRLLAELDVTDAVGPGSVQWDPNFPLPPHFANHEFHLQTGGYDDQLGGYIYHLGGNVFRSGRNEIGRSNRIIVDTIPIPKDGRIDRVLELGCSAGMTSVQLKKRFVQAEVWATDLSAGMVRYAHRYAIEMDEIVHFKQMAAEAISFPNDHFDLVFAHILYHEMSTEATRQSLAECHRVLRPGGVLAISDVPDHTHISDPVENAMVRYENGWQANHNGEIFYEEFFDNDFAQLMAEAGFTDIDPKANVNAGVWAANLSLPMRLGYK